MRTSADETRDAEPRMSSAGVIIAAIIAMAVDGPVTVPIDALLLHLA